MTTGEIGFFKHVEILSTLDEAELENVGKYLEEVTCGAGKEVFLQDDEGKDLYIVREGVVSVRVRASEGVEVDIADLGAGDFFGDMALFEDAPRSATCLMNEGGKVYRLRRSDFFSLMTEHPATAIKMMSKMASITTGRLQNASAFLTDLVQWGEGARRRAITDDLTGLHNRRYLDDALDEQLAQAKVRGDRLSLIMMDLDRFHEINDEYGQPFGDQVIAEVAPSVGGSIGEKDLAARYGGDEFVVIVPSRTAEETLEIAEKIRSAVGSLSITSPTGKPVPVTTSLGVAEFPTHATDAESLRENSDKALYAAKEGGRDRATIFSTE